MSTDYGFLCKQCPDKRAIIDNARYSAVDELKSVLANFHKIEAVRALGLTVRMEEHYYNVSGAFDFVREHRALGHEVVVGDEYGREHDQCDRRVRCGECGASYNCTDKSGHDGECKK